MKHSQNSGKDHTLGSPKWNLARGDINSEMALTQPT